MGNTVTVQCWQCHELYQKKGTRGKRTTPKLCSVECKAEWESKRQHDITGGRLSRADIKAHLLLRYKIYQAIRDMGMSVAEYERTHNMTRSAISNAAVIDPYGHFVRRSRLLGIAKKVGVKE